MAVADVQRAGRGRLGRTWESPPGASLLMSVLLRPHLPRQRLNLAVAAMALAACAACEDVAGVSPGIKWPNDLVLVGTDGTDRKLAGVLAEVDLPAVVVGLGLNVDWAGAEPPGGGTCLGPWDRGELLEAVLARLEDRLHDWDGVASDYRSRCITVGHRVRVEVGGASFTGKALDITPEGHLVVSGDRPRTVTAGEVTRVVRS